MMTDWFYGDSNGDGCDVIGDGDAIWHYLHSFHHFRLQFLLSLHVGDACVFQTLQNSLLSYLSFDVGELIKAYVTGSWLRFPYFLWLIEQVEQSQHTDPAQT